MNFWFLISNNGLWQTTVNLANQQKYFDRKMIPVFWTCHSQCKKDDACFEISYTQLFVVLWPCGNFISFDQIVEFAFVACKALDFSTFNLCEFKGLEKIYSLQARDLWSFGQNCIEGLLETLQSHYNGQFKLTKFVLILFLRKEKQS